MKRFIITGVTGANDIEQTRFNWQPWDKYYKFAEYFNLASNNKQELKDFIKEHPDYIEGLLDAYNIIQIYAKDIFTDEQEQD